jgi:hypothetical protein
MEASSEIAIDLIQNMRVIAVSNLTAAQHAYKSYKQQLTRCNTLYAQYHKASTTVKNRLYKSFTPRSTVEEYEDIVSEYEYHATQRKSHQTEAKDRGTRAERGFQRALTEAAKLPAETANEVNVEELRLYLAFAYEVCEKWSNAEAILRELTVTARTRHAAAVDDDDVDDGDARVSNSEQQPPRDTPFSLRACHALSALYLYLHESQARQAGTSLFHLDQAYTFNRRALLGRRRMFGGDHKVYHDSLRVAIAIYKAMGETEVAEGHAAALRNARVLGGGTGDGVDEAVVLSLDSANARVRSNRRAGSVIVVEERRSPARPPATPPLAYRRHQRAASVGPWSRYA